MIEKPMDVLRQFPIRKSKKQKMQFREEIKAYLESKGYPVSVEQGSYGANNVVIGDPDRAKLLITAHYDTPASIGVPNILTPCNPVTFVLWQLFLVGMFMIMAIIPGVVIGVLLNDPNLAGTISMLLYWVLLILLLVGPANKNNANDNTSGVVTLLETALSWPEKKRDMVCFVLFDLEEAGLIGSSSYRKAHKSATDKQIVLNLDCVGDGNEIMLFPMKKLKKDPQKMDLLRRMCGLCNDKAIVLHEKGFATYPSDQKHYPYGVGIAAFNRKKGIGLYVDRIHTCKDTILDETNVNYLRDAFLKLADVHTAE